MACRRCSVYRLLWICCFILVFAISWQNLTSLVDPPIFIQSPKTSVSNYGWPPRMNPSWLRQQNSSGYYDDDGTDLCQVFPGEGEEGRRGYQALNIIRLTLVSQQQQQQNAPLPTPPTSVRVLCLIFTHSNHHDNLLASAMKTYAPRCDGVVAFSNVTDFSRGTISLALNNTNVATVEELNSQDDSNIIDTIGWNTMRRALGYVHEHYFDDYDVFHFAPDDTYVVVDNLRSYASSLATRLKNVSNVPLYLGALMPMMKYNPKRRYCDGRAGFTLNRDALQVIVNQTSRSSSCGNETQPVDIRIAECFDQHNIVCFDTSDRDDATFYHPFTIYDRSNLLPNNKNITFPWLELKNYHKMSPKGGTGGISPSTITFRSNHHHRYHSLLYGACDAIWEKHRDALDEHGNPGYVHNATFFKSHPPPFDFSHGDCNIPFGNGTEGAFGYKGLQKVKIATKGDKKVLCMVYTHSHRHHRLRAIAETYGSRCDGFFAASNQTDRSIGAVHLLHEGPEEYTNMWMKVRSMWEYAYDHYLNDFEYFMIGGDDYYVVAENLKYFVSTGNWKGPWNHSQPLFLGGSSINMPYTRRRYCGGGAGYTLNRASLRLLIEQLWRSPGCWPHHRASDEDRIISSCFEAVGIRCMDTNDKRNETTYHNLDAEFHAKWNHQEPSPWRAKDLERYHGITSLEGMGQISEISVSFHLKLLPDDGMRRYHAILYGLCNATSINDEV